jgi:xanthine dehydrogenase large subunit
VEIASYRCKTNTQSHTAFRGFGGPQGVILIEAILGDIARKLGKDPLDVRKANLYGMGERDTTHYQMKVEDNILHPLLDQIEQTSRYRSGAPPSPAWNASSPVIKRGIAITPVKFGISFTATFFNQAGALVHVYTDGSVQVNHGGTEMGQGLHTKIMQVVADELGVPFERVRITPPTPARCPTPGHGGIQRHRPERPRGAVRGAQHPRQPGGLRRRPGRLRRRRRDLPRRPGHRPSRRATSTPW